MDLDHIRQRLDHERRYLARDGETIDVRPHLTRVSRGPQRWVSWSSLDELTAEEVIAEELRYHRESSSAFEWKYYGHDNPSDLLQRLQRHGLVAGQPEAVMVYDLSKGPPRCDNSGCTVTRVTRLEQIDHYRRVAEEALGKDYGLTSGELAAALAEGSTQHLGYVAYVGTEPVSIGRLYTHPLSEFGGLYGGTTREGYRSRGFYRAVVAARAFDAIELGARYLIVDALPTSQQILGQLGFRHLADTIPCELPVKAGET
jgi:hypothetical protein